MFMRKLLLFSFSLLFLANVVSAQIRLHAGANTAVNTSFVLDKGLQEDPRYNSKMTYTLSPIGFSFGADFKSGFSLQLESILAKYGQVYEIVNIAKQAVGERRIDLTYVNLPLLLRFIGNPDAKARLTFMLGPQLSLLTAGKEIVNFAAGTYQFPQDIIYQKPDIPNAFFAQTPTGVEVNLTQLQQQGLATQNPDGSWNVQLQGSPSVIIAEKGAIDPLRRFRNTDLQIAAGIGLDFRINEKLYGSTQIRANYGIVDMRGQDLIDRLQAGTAKDIFGQRANLLIGIQIGLNYIFGK
jgi:hypothetical protein